MTPQSRIHYDWDENKSLRNFQIRGFGFDLIRQFDWSTAITRQDLRSTEEERWVSTGLIAERLYIAVWTQRGIITRTISLRKANDREVYIYERARS